MKEALFYRQMENGVCECLLCPHRCKIAPGKEGLCMARRNIEGKLYAVNYAKTVSIAIDPIEKKPLYNFYPGTQILSIAPNSCNMKCPYCQNYEISQKKSYTYELPVSELVRILKEHPSVGVAYTYTEPLTWYEYLLDAGYAVKEAGYKNVLVTNGMINEEPLKHLLPVIDAVNVDLKSIRPEFYRELVKGDLETVKNFIKILHSEGKHVEVTNLVIPGYNDTDEDFEKLTDFIAGVSPDIPVHFTRFFPHYKFYDLHPTPVERLKRAYEIAVKKLHYVYLGNVLTGREGNTYCPYCGNLLIERGYFYDVRISGVEKGKCKKCGEKVNIVMD